MTTAVRVMLSIYSRRPGDSLQRYGIPVWMDEAYQAQWLVILVGVGQRLKEGTSDSDIGRRKSETKRMVATTSDSY